MGNITQQVDNAQQIHYFSNSVIEPNGMYKYDALYRLTEAKGREFTSLQLPTHEDFVNNFAVPNTASNAMQNYTQQYSYDELGNINQMKSVGKWTRDYYYNFTANNYLLGHTENTTEYTYDAHGNITQMPHLPAMAWSYKDELKEVILNAGGDKAYYVYDASGNRALKVVVKGNIREERYYLGDYEVYRKFVSNSLYTERTTVHVSDDKKKIALLEKQTVNEGSLTPNSSLVTRYQYDDHLGSASLELNENANIISYEEYHPFGTTSYLKHNTNISQKRYKYVGKERDEETGLYYYGARYYAAWLCRFVSVDALQFKYPELTPFQYASNNPITNIDLDGLEGANFQGEKNNTIKFPSSELKTSFSSNDRFEQISSTIQNTDYQSSSNNRVSQAMSGSINIAAGLTTTIIGAGIAIGTAPSIAGAVGGAIMMMEGLSQTVIGISQIVDAGTNGRVGAPPVSGVTELIGYHVSEKTGNPYYRVAGAGLDMLSGINFYSEPVTFSRTMPLISNVVNIASEEKAFRILGEASQGISTISTVKGNYDYIREKLDEKYSLLEDLDPESIFNMSIETKTINYKIKKGDTLSEIAKQFNTDLGTLSKMNNIDNPDKIYEGGNLKVYEQININIQSYNRNGN